MDLNKKLNFYRSEKKNQQSPAIPSSLLAIREIFDGEICARQAPYLKIIKDYPLARPQKVNLAHLSKYSIPDSVTLDKCLFFDLETRAPQLKVNLRITIRTPFRHHGKSG